jgi:hypothetical protein
MSAPPGSLSRARKRPAPAPRSLANSGWSNQPNVQLSDSSDKKQQQPTEGMFPGGGWFVQNYRGITFVYPEGQLNGTAPGCVNFSVTWNGSNHSVPQGGCAENDTPCSFSRTVEDPGPSFCYKYDDGNGCASEYAAYDYPAHQLDERSAIILSSRGRRLSAHAFLGLAEEQIAPLGRASGRAGCVPRQD